MNEWFNVGSMLSSLLGVSFGTAILYYFRDRKVHRAKGAVAEGTVAVRVDEDRLSLLRQTQDAEREVWSATHNHLRAELAEARLELEEKDHKIAELVRLVDELRDETNKLQRKLTTVEEKLAQIIGPQQ